MSSSQQEFQQQSQQRTNQESQPFLIGGAQIHLQNVQIRDDVRLDEVHLDGGGLRLELNPDGGDPQFTSEETRIRIVLSEPNLNRLLSANLPPDMPVRDLQIALLSGKAHLSGQYVKFLAIPFSLDAVPRIENGVRISLDCKNASFGVGMPRAIVDIVQQQLNDRLRIDVSGLPIPVWLDELQCEPGRLTATGRARISWPLAQSAAPTSAFSVVESRSSEGALVAVSGDFSP